jgi:hypothetical protein
MKALMIAAALVTAVAASAPAAHAADLDDGYTDRHSSPYDDPRYRDLYGSPSRYTERYEYKERSYRPPVPPQTVYRDDDYLPGPRRYVEHPRFGAPCLPRHEIRRRLQDEGWSDFHELDVGNATASVRARRPSGELYDLRVDRCSGTIVDARPFDRYVPGPYASGPPRRWARPYY